MRQHWTLILMIVGLTCLFAGCGSQNDTALAPSSTAAPPTPVPPTLLPTRTMVPPTATLPAPIPSSTALPPTPIPPTSTPIPEPTPTKTPIPHGSLTGCIYFEGELVVGYISFHNDYGPLKELQTQTTSGCATIRLRPGKYEVGAAYYQGSVCAYRAAGCVADRTLIEIAPEGSIEMDFHVVPAGSVRD